LYLTFDDGPNKGTRNVLDIVKDEQIPVSFFLVGIHVSGSAYQQQLWDSLQATSDIDLCNHSYSHANNRYSAYYENAGQVVADFDRTKDSLHLSNNIARTPGRNIWRIDSLHYTDIAKSAAAADSLQQAGFILMGWDVEWKYNDKTFQVAFDADNLMAQIDSSFAHHKTHTANNLVLLAHDQVYAKTDDSMQLRRFLQRLKQRDDYELSLVTHYPGVDKGLASIVSH
jgi:peptidoglycan/xylan/chitin deacetylase (PgdA/CDA1 family)